MKQSTKALIAFSLVCYLVTLFVIKDYMSSTKLVVKEDNITFTNEYVDEPDGSVEEYEEPIEDISQEDIVITDNTVGEAPVTNKEVYNTDGVYITIGTYKYNIKGGTKLYKDNEYIFDFKRLTFNGDSFVYDRTMANSLLITDLSYDIWEGHIIIFAVGIAFKPNDIDYNDTSNYVKGLVNAGTPYTMVFTYNVDNDTSIYPYERNGNASDIQIQARMMDLYIAPYNTEVQDIANTTDTSNIVFNYASMVVHPKLIKSSYYEHTVFMLLEETDYGEALSNTRHVKLYKINTSRTSDAVSEKPKEYMYITFDYMESIAEGIDDSYKFNPLGMYVMEQDKDKFLFVNENTMLNVAAEFYIPNGKNPELIQQYYKRP